MAIPVQLHATDLSNPVQPEPTKKKDAHARNSTQTGRFHIVAVNRVDSSPNTPTLIDSAVALDTVIPLGTSVLMLMIVIVIVIVVRQSRRLQPRAPIERASVEEVLLRGESAECLPELAVVHSRIARLVDTRFVDRGDQMDLELVPLERTGPTHVHDQSKEPALPRGVEDQLPVGPR